MASKYISFDTVKSEDVEGLMSNYAIDAVKYSKYLFKIDRMALGEEETKLNIQNRDIKMLVDL
eukprot:CAMPEP_0116898168 /NCGR_PEP_ID=MMETSP0467-20121206/6938_1 /TAXON_ID=283647 /ORGANISM="Mesodinium pulex, Strain SPMC105" /LENGTH=62 /DNA_ID=CAMNT_0004570121 /DNA_START=1148 /DNA_END=1336 /DNA_ORIENTATION=-